MRFSLSQTGAAMFAAATCAQLSQASPIRATLSSLSQRDAAAAAVADAALSRVDLASRATLMEGMFPEERRAVDADAETASLDKRLVVNPNITSPTQSTVWMAGQQASVTWGTSDVPVEAQNYTTRVVLGFLPADGSGGENLSVTLADNIPILSGQANFTVPSNTTSRNDYIVVVFGDSGNASPKFTINGAAPTVQ